MVRPMPGTEDIDDAVRGSPVWREKENLLSSVPGIGLTISRDTARRLPELGTLGRPPDCCLVGLAPFTRQSGQWRGRSFIGGGRAAVRSTIFMGAMVAPAATPSSAALSRAHRRRQAQNGRSIAVARRLLTILNAILRDKRPWQKRLTNKTVALPFVLSPSALSPPAEAKGESPPPKGGGDTQRALFGRPTGARQSIVTPAGRAPCPRRYRARPEGCRRSRWWW